MAQFRAVFLKLGQILGWPREVLKITDALTHLRTITLDSLGDKAPTLVHFKSSPSLDLEGIMLSEKSQTEKDKYCVISLMYGI